MKFKLPTSIPILGKTIKVKLADSKDFYGWWDFENHTIFISIHQKPEEIEETFHHELEHCIQWMTALNQAIPKELLETMAEMRARILPAVNRKIYK